jgi:GLPGLI family protein
MCTWKILSDTVNILGYKCQKAVINYMQNRYTAWFTTALAYKAGPDIFYGLPGLILKVYNDGGNLGYEAIEIKTPYKGVIPTFKNEGETISRDVWINTIATKN